MEARFHGRVGSTGPAAQNRHGDVSALKQEVTLAKRRFNLPAEAPVVSCYEAGRDGFWLHRFLESEHITNLVVDSASIEVSRRGKNAKTDRLDVEKLLTMLVRYHAGETRVWSVVHVPWRVHSFVPRRAEAEHLRSAIESWERNNR